ncbi:MAG: SDR family oxidoreductase [Candidatus Obscuribacterales bacterium]|nr:SDR family oxidoreductase [Steroidobacteraceae bacterium]
MSAIAELRMNIQGKVIVITGAGRGIGRAMALVFAECGANLALLDMSADEIEETARLCTEKGAHNNVVARGYRCNVAQETDVATSFKQIATDFERLDALINNAGITRDSLLVKVKEGQVTGGMSLAQWQQVIDVNLTGVFLCGREAASRMITLGNGGVIINIASISRAGNIGQTNYSAAKSGVHAMAVTWAKELARYGIRAAAIAPGFIQTDILNDMKPEVLERTLATVPLKRAGIADEIAHGALFILTNDYYTGRILEIDGGLRI